MLQEAAAYAAFANGGHSVTPVAVLRVEDSDGKLLWSQTPGMRQPVLDERVAYLISNILSDNTARIPSFGEESVLKLTRPAAVKTGTTTDFRDNWTVGYTPDLVVGVWAGNADNEPMLEISGVSGAAPIWHDFMERALKGSPVHDFRRPSGLVEVEVCALSGLLPGPDCPHRVTELFLAGTEPTETCTMHQRVAIDRATGLRAAADTPPDRIVQKVYTILPPEAQAWGREQGIDEPPPAVVQQAASGEQQIVALAPGQGSPLVMGSPDDGAVYRLDPGLPPDAQRIEVRAYPATGVSLREVTLLVDGQPLAKRRAPPYEVLWQLELGSHTFSAEAVTISGKRVASEEVT
ncbi:MAG TPA: penicillin-binding transpeptidase domain-containing protein, partial [Mycobacterium sp.]|nr:penicillin-binding transpeptidase domain-containing protein [Mycobacterium sp.]